MNSKPFLSDNSLYNDDCAILTKNLQNQSIDDYTLTNFYPSQSCGNCTLDKNQLLLDNPNLHARDGYGNANSCIVDLDSQMRLGELVHPKGREQLCARVFEGVPNLNRGGLIPNLESRLKSPEDTSSTRDCCRITEMDYDRWIPLPSCMATEVQNPKHIVPELVDKTWVHGGANTRDYVRDNNYLEHCGFIQRGNAWVKPDQIGPTLIDQERISSLLR